MMERFLERISMSKYNGNFILKGGILVSAFVGIRLRATIDIDATIKAIPIALDDLRNTIEEILSVRIDDGVEFAIIKYSRIMEGHDYPGFRFIIESRLERLHQPIQIDISTGDIITPGAVEYQYKMIFEDRTIPMWTYNLETLLAEKIETIISRGLANTRMRDFYDLYILTKDNGEVDLSLMQKALIATCNKRSSSEFLTKTTEIMREFVSDKSMEKMWNSFKESSFFVGELKWEEVSLYANDYIEKVIYSNL